MKKFYILLLFSVLTFTKVSGQNSKVQSSFDLKQNQTSYSAQKKGPISSPAIPLGVGDERWEALADFSNLSGAVSNIVAFGSDIYVTGYFTNADGNKDDDGVAVWNGTTWN